MIKVLNTRPSGQNGELSALLRKAGFEPVEVPLVEILAREEGVARARKTPPSGFTGIFLSSPNGLKHLQAGLAPEAFGLWMKKPFFLVGSRTRPMVEALGGKVAFAPGEASLEGFLQEYTGMPGPGSLLLMQKWLHPCSASTRLETEAFRKKHIEVENLPIYEPGCPAGVAERLAKEKDVYAVVFCSGSAVNHFFREAPELAASLGAPKGVLAVSIGPSTSQALADHGVARIAAAARADNAGLLDALREALGGAETQVLKRKPPEGKP